MTAPIEVTGELGNLCAARQAELEAARKKKNDREAEIKRLITVNAELLEVFEAAKEYIRSPWMNCIALSRLGDAIERVEGS